MMVLGVKHMPRLLAEVDRGLFKTSHNAKYIIFCQAELVVSLM